MSVAVAVTPVLNEIVAPAAGLMLLSLTALPQVEGVEVRALFTAAVKISSVGTVKTQLVPAAVTLSIVPMDMVRDSVVKEPFLTALSQPLLSFTFKE